MEKDEERKARLERMIATTQLRLAPKTEEERRGKNGLDMIWIKFWIEIGVLISGNELGTIFLVYVSVYMSTRYVKILRRNYVAQTHACSKSVLGG